MGKANVKKRKLELHSLFSYETSTSIIRFFDATLIDDRWSGGEKKGKFLIVVYPKQLEDLIEENESYREIKKLRNKLKLPRMHRRKVLEIAKEKFRTHRKVKRMWYPDFESAWKEFKRLTGVDDTWLLK